MARTPVRKPKKDAVQDKRIAKLERQFPTVNEVVNNAGSLLYDDTTSGHVYSLLPSALDNEKVEFRGYSMRNLSTKDPNTAQDVRFRIILCLYKCTADYSSAGSPTYTPPVINDILNGNGDKTLANYNPDTRSRVRIISDRTYVTDSTITNTMVSQSKMYKRSIQFMPLVDKAFVTRPFLVIVSGDTSSSKKLTLAHDIDLHTRQAP